ncbi:MAG TPA: MFS transporter [Nitrososphaeraceae archaeon]|nr:MFS transporter [Nitrososphaeraceae archaeon]
MVEEKRKEDIIKDNIDKPSPSSSSQSLPVSNISSDKKNKISTYAWMTLVILGSTILLTMYGETMLLPAIPDIITEFNISYNTASWILTAYLIAGAVMTPISGKLSDIYGRKKIVLIIMLIYLIGIVLGGLSSNITILILSRIIQGIGISMFPIAFGIVRDQFPPEKLAIGVGTFSAMFAAGSVVGLAIGGSIIQSFGWRMTFLSIIPIAILLWFIIKRFINDSNTDQQQVIQYSSSEQKSTSTVRASSEQTQSTDVDSDSNRLNNLKDTAITKSIDIKGAITLAVTISSFLIVLSYLETGSSNDGGNRQVGQESTSIPIHIIVSLISIAIISLISFIVIEKRTKSPLIDLKLITDRIILPANILLLFSFLAMFTVYQTIPILVRSPSIAGGFGGDAITTANIQLPFMIVFLLFAPSSGFIISKLGNIKPTLIGTIISTIGFFSIFLLHSTETMLAGTLAIIATGLSLSQVGGFNIVLESTPKQFSGISLGMTVLLNLIGGAIGPAIAGISMQANQVFVNGSLFPSPESYNLIFFSTALVSVVSVILALLIKKRTVSDAKGALKKEVPKAENK